MTATPLKDEILLEELKDLERIDLEWLDAIPVKIEVIDTRNTVSELCKLIENPEKEINYHMFVNSITTISRIIKKTKIKDYKIVCSDTSKAKTKLNVESTTTLPKNIIFILQLLLKVAIL